MKSPQDILQYIENWQTLFLDRPESYFLTPEEMENVLTWLELLHEFIIDDQWSFPGYLDLGYNQFLQDEGYGVMTFAQRQSKNSKSFTELPQFWRRYLASDKRKHLSDNQA